MPVIVINKLEQAVPLAKALVAGGVRVLEVTLRTACGLEAIRAIANEVPEYHRRRYGDQSAAAAGVTEAGAQIRHQPGLTEALLQAATVGPIPLIGHQHRFRADAKRITACARIQILPAEANGGVKRCRRSAARSHRCVLPDRRHYAEQLPRLFGAEKRALHRRFTAGAGGCARTATIALSLNWRAAPSAEAAL